MMDQVYWSPGVTLEMIEKQVILNAFRFYRGNKTQCSISLGISIRTLENKLEKYEQDGLKQQEVERLDAIEREKILERHRGIIPSSKSEEGGARIHGTNAGVHLQPSPETTTQRTMSVQEREKVQGVLPQQPAASGAARRR